MARAPRLLAMRQPNDGLRRRPAANRRELLRGASPLGLEGLLTNPGTPGGTDGGEANPTELHEGVQGAGSEAAAGRRQGAVGGGDGAWHWHRAAQPVAHRAPGGRLGRGTGRPQGGAGGNAATEARGEAARRGGGGPSQSGGLFCQGGWGAKVALCL